MSADKMSWPSIERGGRLYAVPQFVADELATLRARLAEVEGERDEAVERLREELKRGIRLEAKLSEAAALFPGLRDAIVEEVEAEFKARVEKLEACLALCRQCRGHVACKDCPNAAALAECGEGE